MKLNLFLGVLLSAALTVSAAEPLRVFIRAGVKTHGPGQHDHPRFLAEWTKLLAEHGLKADGAMDFPAAEQLDQTDVLVIFAADGMKVVGEQRERFEKFLRRGGGLVVIHDGVVSGDEHEWAKKVQGGAWRWDGDKKTKWYEGEVGEYFVDTEHPITRGISNFDWKDEVYYDLDMAPDARVLATSFHTVFVIAPQLWTYEKTWEGGSAPYRAFVSLPGHEFTSFNTPHYRAILLRGIAWAGKRENVDEFCLKEELASLKYPEGGPTAPDKAAAKLNVHPDFNLSLVASEPLIEKAISLDWDPQGRLWVAETPEYPNGRRINRADNAFRVDRARDPDAFKSEKENRPGRDRISWLEDTDGDGVMDRKHVFADSLELVTSLVFYRDGVIVAQAPDILWLRDLDGDGKCDKPGERVTLYTGFGTGDTHAVINNFRWGMDGWVYGAIGYSAGDPISPDGKKKFGRVTAGVIRFRPDGSALEQVVSGSCNTWGFDFNWDGEMFYTTATCGEHFLHIVTPDKVLARGSVGGIRGSKYIADHDKVFPAVHHTRPAYVQIDWVGAFTAAAGCCLYNGGAWPARFNGAEFVSEPTVSLVHNEFLKPQGVSYTASKEAGREDTEFIAGNDLWFRPIHTRVGPDGALYVVDFYNQAAIHNDTRGPAHGANNAAVRPDRDHHFSRIWRVQHKQAKRLELPKLVGVTPAELVKALEHPNGWVRLTAHRLLLERGNVDVTPLAKSETAPNYARIHALWVGETLHGLEEPVLVAALNSSDAAVRKTAAVIAAQGRGERASLKKNLLKAAQGDDARLQLEALIALGSFEVDQEVATALVALYPGLNDRYLQSAAVGVAAKNPVDVIDAALNSTNPGALTTLITPLAAQLAEKQDAAPAAKLVIALAAKPAATDALKQSLLLTLTKTLKAETVPSWSPELQKALASLAGSGNESLRAAVLPLVARWDKEGALADELKTLIKDLTARLNNEKESDDVRAQIATSLLGVRKQNEGILPAVSRLLGSTSSVALQKRIVEALGATADKTAGEKLVEAFPQLPGELVETAFGQLIKRSDWSLALVDALKTGKVSLASVGPGNTHRLRTHSDREVARRAGEVIDELRGPEVKEKNDLIAKLLPDVEKAGTPDNGHKTFTANCAGCHKFNGEGRDLAPDLTGMGVHGPAELLVHVVDPNRMVEPNFISTSIETKDDQSFTGIIARENRRTLLLRDATTDTEIKIEDIKNRRSTGRSLMPEGFEALGGEGLRDLFAYMCAGEAKYRLIDLKQAFNADGTKGLYVSLEVTNDGPRFRKFGLVKGGDVPFEIVAPAKSSTGNNLIVLKGGSGAAKTRVQKIEVPNLNLKASQLHFLGGIGGWAWPFGGEDRNKGLPVLKVTVSYADGQAEELVFKNGAEFTDWNNPRLEVPGSKQIPNAVANGQVRWFSRALHHAGVMQKLTLESYDNDVAPTLVAITAELGEATARAESANAGAETKTAAAAAPAPVSFKWGEGIKTLIVGGGSSHDFNKWFNQADSTTLSANSRASVNYTDQIAAVLPALKDIDVLYWSSNQPFNDPALRQGLFDFTKAGKGLLLVHPGLWYNWSDWPEYNRTFAVGGSRGHDRFGEFEVTVEKPDHAIMAGVPRTFKISDELYNHQLDESATTMEVLATGKSPVTGKTFPVVWITKHPQARIVCITLGHDGKAHELEAFKTLLQNALNWAAAK